jgi:hypothetical protein
MTDDPISRIEAALEAGPKMQEWYIRTNRHRSTDGRAWGWLDTQPPGGSQSPLAGVSVTWEAGSLSERNARFIAACNPVAIRTLLDRLKAAEQRAEYWKAEQLAANTENERLRESLRGLLTVTSSKAPGAGLIAGAEERHAAAIKQARAALEGKE